MLFAITIKERNIRGTRVSIAVVSTEMIDTGAFTSLGVQLQEFHLTFVVLVL